MCILYMKCWFLKKKWTDEKCLAYSKQVPFMVQTLSGCTDTTFLQCVFKKAFDDILEDI